MFIGNILNGIAVQRRRRCQVIFAVIFMEYYFVRSQQKCETFSLVKEDHRLKDHLIYEKLVKNRLECVLLCLAEIKRCPPCKSANFHKKEKKCQLNNVTTHESPDNLVPDKAFDQFEPANFKYSGYPKGYKVKGSSNHHAEAACCTNGWISYENSCYLFVTDTQGPLLTWQQSRQNCLDKNADLVSIHDAAETDFVHSQTEGIGDDHLYWIGLYRDSADPALGWLWSDGTDFTMNPEQWSPGEPNNDQGNEGCANMNGLLKLWNDIPCTLERASICKKSER